MRGLILTALISLAVASVGDAQTPVTSPAPAAAQSR